MVEEAQIQAALNEMKELIHQSALEITNELRSVGFETRGMKEQLAKQNGRVQRLEEWRQRQEIAQARKEGKQEEHDSLSKQQTAIILAFAPFIFVGLELAIRLFF